MNPKKSPDEKVVNAGIGLPPNLIKRLDKEKGDHSRSKKAAIILREYFDALDKKKRPKSPGDSTGTNRFTSRQLFTSIQLRARSWSSVISEVRIEGKGMKKKSHMKVAKFDSKINTKRFQSMADALIAAIDPGKLRRAFAETARQHLELNGFPKRKIAKLTDEEAIWVAREHMARFLGLRDSPCLK